MQEWKDDDDGDHVEFGCSMQHHLGYIFDEEICDCLTAWLVSSCCRYTSIPHVPESSKGVLYMPLYYNYYSRFMQLFLRFYFAQRIHENKALN